MSRRILCFLALSFALVCASRSQRTQWPVSQTAKIDSIFAPLADDKSPGLAVLVRQNGRTIFERGYGVCDLRTRAKIDAETNFRLASCTKEFTAMAVMLLVHDGKLRYEDKLADIFPDFPSYAKAITIQNLLNHTSGLPDYEGLMGAAEKPSGAPLWTEAHQIQDEEVLGLLKKETKGKFAAGTKWSYSNSGYVVLGLLAAKISGKPFPEFLRERIFAPLKMERTLAYQKGRNEVERRAYGYSESGDKFIETDQSATSATLGDGGVYSSVEDLAKWDEALARHTLLSEREMQPALVPAQLTDGSQTRWPADREPSSDNLYPGKPVSYGFGWFLDPDDRHTRIYHTSRPRGYRSYFLVPARVRMYHSGGTLGFRTYISRFTADKLTVIVLCNRTDLDPEKLALQVSDLFLR